MNKEIIKVKGHTVAIYVPASGPLPLVYSVTFGDEGDATADHLFAKEDGGPAKCVFVTVSVEDWNMELSPWPAAALFKGEDDFGGKAQVFLGELTLDIMPEVEKYLGFKPVFNAIAGYSMAGMFSVFAIYKTEMFMRGVSASGSLWYDGFVDYMAACRPQAVPERFYFSLGNKEKKARNQLMATVEDQTARAEEIMKSYGTETIFEMNSGGHFSEPERRTAKGIKWMLR